MQPRKSLRVNINMTAVRDQQPKRRPTHRRSEVTAEQVKTSIQQMSEDMVITSTWCDGTKTQVVACQQRITRPKRVPDDGASAPLTSLRYQQIPGILGWPALEPSLPCSTVGHVQLAKWSLLSKLYNWLIRAAARIFLECYGLGLLWG